jgi:hypothetical protein
MPHEVTGLADSVSQAASYRETVRRVYQASTQASVARLTAGDGQGFIESS